MRKSVLRSTIRNTALILALPFALWHCQSTFTVDVVDADPSLVVNGQLSPDRFFSLNVLSTTSPFADDGGELTGDIQVVLTDLTEGREIALYREDASRFAHSGSRPVAGHTYAINVSAPGYQDAEAVTTVPEPIVPENIAVRDLRISQSEFNPLKKNISYDLEMQVPRSAAGYLHVMFFQRSTVNVGSLDEPDFRQVVYEMQPQFPEESGFVEHFELGVLIDLFETSQEGRLTFSFKDFTIEQFEELGPLLIEVRTLSTGYFNYYESLTQQLSAREDPFAEPVDVQTNVSGGLGNFSSYHSVAFELTPFR